MSAHVHICTPGSSAHLLSMISTCLHICTSSCVHVCTSAHHCTACSEPPPLHHLCTSSLHHICIISVSPLHHLCITSASPLLHFRIQEHLSSISAPHNIRTSAPPYQEQLHMHLCTLHLCTSSPLHIFTSSPLHLCTSAHQHILVPAL